MNLRSTLYLLVILSGFNNLFGQSRVPVSVNIDSVIAASDAVQLEEDAVFTVQDNNSGQYTYHTKLLIKNSGADNYCLIHLAETEFYTVSDIKAVIKDTLGNVLKELDDDDIKTALITPGYSYYSNEVHKYFSLKYSSYPFIFEYSYVRNFKTLFFWPAWIPQGNIPSLSSTYKLILETPVKFKYHKIGEIGDPVIEEHDGTRTYTWNKKNIINRVNEDFLPPENKLQMALLFSPESFELKGYKGELNNWRSFGSWYGDLTRGRYNLPATAVAEIKALVRGAKTPEEKIGLLYSYLREKTHYVDIELGISGWQPQTAGEVYTNHYGDCKDLTTLMVSMLKVIGIKSYPALALTRDRGEVISDFPSNQFNHCIAFVPLKHDSIWIECTAKYMDIGDTPSDIQGIRALVVDETGGSLVTTPLKSAPDNLWISRCKCVLNNSGTLNFNTSLSLKGNQKSYFKPALSYFSNEDKMVFLKRQFGRHYSNIVINKYSVDDPESSRGLYSINLQGSYANVIQGVGQLIFINPNLFNRKSPDALPEEEPGERQFPVYYKFPYEDIDSVVIELPSNYDIVAMPDSVNLSGSFGNFSAVYKLEDGKIIYNRKFEIKEREIPLSAYKNYREFIRSVIKADKFQLVLKRH